MMLSVRGGGGGGGDTPGIVSYFSSNSSMNGHGNYVTHLSVFGIADSFPGNRSNKLS